jgi:hypothetical protein
MMQRRVRANPAGPAGDRERAAEFIVQVTKHYDPPTHLLLGVNAVEMALTYSQLQLTKARTWERVSRSADFVEPYPVELPTRTPR